MPRSSASAPPAAAVVDPLTVTPNGHLYAGDEIHYSATISDPYDVAVLAVCDSTVVANIGDYDQLCSAPKDTKTNSAGNATWSGSFVTEGYEFPIEGESVFYCNRYPDRSCVLAISSSPDSDGPYEIKASTPLVFERSPFNYREGHLDRDHALGTNVNGTSSQDPLGTRMFAFEEADITITESQYSAPAGFVNQKAVITAPDLSAAAGQPYAVDFYLDNSLRSIGKTIAPYLDGVSVPACSPSGDPFQGVSGTSCVQTRRFGSNYGITVLSFTPAGEWTFLLEQSFDAMTVTPSSNLLDEDLLRYSVTISKPFHRAQIALCSSGHAFLNPTASPEYLCASVGSISGSSPGNRTVEGFARFRANPTNSFGTELHCDRNNCGLAVVSQATSNGPYEITSWTYLTYARAPYDHREGYDSISTRGPAAPSADDPIATTISGAEPGQYLSIDEHSITATPPPGVTYIGQQVSIVAPLIQDHPSYAYYGWFELDLPLRAANTVVDVYRNGVKVPRCEIGEDPFQPGSTACYSYRTILNGEYRVGFRARSLTGEWNFALSPASDHFEVDLPSELGDTQRVIFEGYREAPGALAVYECAANRPSSLPSYLEVWKHCGLWNASNLGASEGSNEFRGALDVSKRITTYDGANNSYGTKVCGAEGSANACELVYFKIESSEAYTVLSTVPLDFSGPTTIDEILDAVGDRRIDIDAPERRTIGERSVRRGARRRRDR